NDMTQIERLERTLFDVGRSLRYPETPDLAARVRARVATGRAARERWTLRGLVPAFATALLLLVVIALASPGVRSAAREFLHLRGIAIFPVPSAPASPSSSPSVFGGQRVSLDEARALVRFAIRVPTAPELGAPDAVYVDTSASFDRVTLEYTVRS